MERHGGFGGFGGSIDCTDEEGQERVFAQGDALPALASISASAPGPVGCDGGTMATVSNRRGI